MARPTALKMQLVFIFDWKMQLKIPFPSDRVSDKE